MLHRSCSWLSLRAARYTQCGLCAQAWKSELKSSPGPAILLDMRAPWLSYPGRSPVEAQGVYIHAVFIHAWAHGQKGLPVLTVRDERSGGLPKFLNAAVSLFFFVTWLIQSDLWSLHALPSWSIFRTCETAERASLICMWPKLPLCCLGMQRNTSMGVWGPGNLGMHRGTVWGCIWGP